MNLTGKNVLIAFFSRTGENYSRGSIVNLTKGNTHVAAEIIGEFCSADMFEIKSANEYPHKYEPCTEAAMKELKADARPELAEDMDISLYDVIFLGFPNWWGTMPMPVWTFLENHDFSGKVIMPFCTHEGSRMGKSETDLKKLIPAAVIKKGLPIHGSSVKESKGIIKNWIEKE